MRVLPTIKRALPDAVLILFSLQMHLFHCKIVHFFTSSIQSIKNERPILMTLLWTTKIEQTLKARYEF